MAGLSGPTMFVRDPRAKPEVRDLRLAPRPADLKGLTVGLVTNSWASFDLILQHYEKLLKERCGVGDVIYLGKETEIRLAKGSRPIPRPRLEELAAKCSVAVVGLGH
ncbi:MAG: hypothetical protein HYX94_00420 [Chloroflexi bacterium]|nr:hypothetical protein [Chloroflexota bacterium]